MKKNSVNQTLGRSEREVAKLDASLREQRLRTDKAHKLAEEMHEEIKKVEENVADRKRKSRIKS